MYVSNIEQGARSKRCDLGEVALYSSSVVVFM